MALERRLSPEEEELQVKQAELDALLDQLAQKELDPETLHAEINTFFLAYNAAVLPKVAEARKLRARIAYAIYILDPGEDTQNESQEARESAKPSHKKRCSETCRRRAAGRTRDRKRADQKKIHRRELVLQ